MMIVEGIEPGFNTVGGMTMVIRAVNWPSLRTVQIEIVPEPAHWQTARPVRRGPRRTQGRGMTVRRTKPRNHRNARRKR